MSILENKDPWWQQSLDDRLEKLSRRAGLRVAYFYDKPTASTFRYRAYNMIDALDEAEELQISAAWFSGMEINRLITILPLLNVLVLVRTPFDQSIARLIAHAQLNKVKIVFDCDDLVFDPKYAYIAAINNDLDLDDELVLNKWFSYVARLNATAQMCDAGIATNEYLASKLKAVVPGSVFVIGNFLNARQESRSRSLAGRKLCYLDGGKDNFTIGYFSGSKTHNKDFLLVSDAIFDLMSRDERVLLKLVGYVEIPESLLCFYSRIERLPYVNWLDLQSEIAEVDLNIAPLQDNDFAFAKSELKYFEAAVVGTYSCVSSSYCYEKAVSKQDLGVVVRDGDWRSALDDAMKYVSGDFDSAAVKELIDYGIRGWSAATYAPKIARTLHALVG